MGSNSYTSITKREFIKLFTTTKGEKMICKKVLMLLLCVSSVTFSTPSYLWVGTYSIDNDPIWGDLDLMNGIATSFWNGANNNHPGIDDNRVLRYVNLEDSNVTVASVSNNYSREQCDFIYIGAHGSTRLQSIWNDQKTTTLGWYTPSMNFGTGSYLRWVYQMACKTLHYDDFDSFFIGDNSWAAAFSGVQVVLGFGSRIWAFNCFNNALNLFWENWTSALDEHSIWEAHRDAVNDGIYNSPLLDDFSVEAAIITSRPAWATSEAEWYWNHTFSEATSEKAVTWATGTRWQVFGTPAY